ncbi:MFS transporter [Gallionella capsiferriformans]|jgi:metabolite-proton symporter|uniref:Major facilitator superfamily MFS_1 n=1 Tax=Gallionella capsiferriformans (strain ES-2) TaxID=395494 RepID=D9SFP6_GALCS|nr:MFS transporter [Gallionella capsiferriformans]ADL55343.1 major facilitator superfamily MFS_1 [Gallionella capsiferriformans ES-2]
MTTTYPSILRIAFASFIGTAIEFYDFYIYGLAVAMVIGPVFFPASDPATQALNAFLTFGIAFVARPIGALLFGHFGDKIGRKTTLAASLLVMGSCTTLIGFLPGYALIGWSAPALLCLLRFGQGIGLGGEWGGAALLAAEHAPKGRRGWFGMFPQLGPPVGFLLAVGSFLLLSQLLDDAQFREWGWRIPFLASAILVIIGLYVRLKLTETPVFAQSAQQAVKLPAAELFRHHAKPLVLGALVMVVCYALFYISTVFSLSYGTTTLGIPRPQFLLMLCVAVLFMAAATPLSAWLGDRFGRRPVLITAGLAALLSGFLLAPALESGSLFQITGFLCLELFLMGATFAPMGALLPELFPTRVRYTGAGAAYNLGGILGASLAPYIAQQLVLAGGLTWVGGYISVAAAISVSAALFITDARDKELT